MTRDDVLSNVKKLAEQLKKEIPVNKFKRSKIVQEEIVEAFKTPVPNAVTVNGRNRMVEKDDWIVIHTDGHQSTYSDEEFKKIFEKISLGKAFTQPVGGNNEAKTDE